MRYMLAAVAGAIAAVAIAALVFVVLDVDLERTSGRTVPDVIGQSLGVAEAELEAQDFDYRLEGSGANPEFEVTQTTPDAGEELAEGGTVTLYTEDL